MTHKETVKEQVRVDCVMDMLDEVLEYVVIKPLRMGRM